MTQPVPTEAETVLSEVERIRAARERIAAERAARKALNLVVVIPEDAQYVDRSLATASWYDVYTVKAGSYPVEFPEYYNHRDAICKVDTVLTEEYRVNRLMGHSRAQTTTPNTEGTYTLRWYAYEPQVGKPVYNGGEIIGHFATAAE